ncbi:type I toxin-antitoxin system toxin IbsC [Escherichia coli]|nr:type I toxin-antitoxin system toxin IbsC [Escherichia coli]
MMRLVIILIVLLLISFTAY